MNATLTTPSEVIAAAKLTGTRKEQVAKKREIIKAWLATEEGREYLAALHADKLEAIGRPAAVNGAVDCYNEIVMEEAGQGRVVRSKAGNYGRVIGQRAFMLTADECAKAGLTPGRGNV